MLVRWLNITALLWVMAANAQTLGRITFGNNPATAISNAAGAAFMGRVSLYGSAEVGLRNDSSLTPIGSPVNTFSPGLFSGGSRYLGIPGNQVTLQVRAWTGDFQTYESALAAALSGEPNVWLGKSRAWEQLTSGDTPTQPIVGQGRLAPFVVQPVPEPSGILLSLLGLAALYRYARGRT